MAQAPLSGAPPLHASPYRFHFTPTSTSPSLVLCPTPTPSIDRTRVLTPSPQWKQGLRFGDVPVNQEVQADGSPHLSTLMHGMPLLASLCSPLPLLPVRGDTRNNAHDGTPSRSPLADPQAQALSTTHAVGDTNIGYEQDNGISVQTDGKNQSQDPQPFDATIAAGSTLIKSFTCPFASVPFNPCRKPTFSMCSRLTIRRHVMSCAQERMPMLANQSYGLRRRNRCMMPLCWR